MIAPGRFDSGRYVVRLPREGLRSLPGTGGDAGFAASPPAPAPGAAVTPARRLRLRVLFALDVVGAGGPGVLMLLAPDKASDLLFSGRLESNAGTQVLGCIWVALGLLSVAGVLRPVRFSPVLLVQFAYKLIWLLAVGLPAAVSGAGVPPVLTAIFAGWVVAVGFAAPWRLLFGPRPAGAAPETTVSQDGAKAPKGPPIAKADISS